MPTQTSRSERRRTPRRLLATRIDLSPPRDADFTSGQTMNISAGGVGVRILETVPEVGSRLDFGFRLEPDGTLLRGELEIVWVNPFHGPAGAHEFGARVVAWRDDAETLAAGL